MKTIITLFFAAAVCGMAMVTGGCGQNSAEALEPETGVYLPQTGSTSDEQFQEVCRHALELPDPGARHARLLKLHLAAPENLDLRVHLAQAARELGLSEAAATWLQSVRGAYHRAADHEIHEAREVSGDSEVVSKMWYLSVLSAWERQEYRDCIEWAAELERSIQPQEASAKMARLARGRLIAARARLAGSIEAYRGCQIIAEMAETAPDLLSDQDLLRAAEFCVHSGEQGEAGRRRRECAAVIMGHYCSGRAYAAGYADVAAELCRDCGLQDEYWIGRIEMSAFSAVSAGGVPAAEASEAAKQVRAVWQLCCSGAWSEAFEAADELRRPEAGLQHRFIDYLHALSRINCQPESRGAQDEYTRLSKYYGRQQAYFVQLCSALSGEAADGEAESAARQLYEQALRGCIAAGPYTAAARTARSALAGLAGIPRRYRAEPLLPAEMQRIAGLVREGGPPELLQPLVKALEWPENRFTLQAGLLLRQVRALPPVRQYLLNTFAAAEQRSRERLQAILQL